MASSLVHYFTKHGLRSLARFSQPVAARVGFSHVQVVDRARACATTSGRRSRRPQKVGASAANSIKVKLPPSPAEIWSKQNAPPPSLERLNLEDSLRAEVLKIGERHGPVAAYDMLVRSTSLEFDAAQVECNAVLQTMWAGLREHRIRWKEWEAQHQKWQEEHATWTKLKHEHEARIQDAKASQEEGISSMESGSEEKGGKQMLDAADIPPEPVEPLAPMPENHGCYLWGNVGRGKSLLMDLFVDCCDKNSDIDLPVMRIHFHEFMQNVHRELHYLRVSGADRTTKVVAKRLAQEVRLIAFDEFQITNIADAMIVETLFDALFAQGVAVLMTTNRPPEDLYKDGLNRHMAIPQFLALLQRRHIIVHELDAARDFRASKVDEASTEEHRGKKNGPWRDFIFKMDTEGVSETTVEARLRAAFTEASGLQAGEPITVPLPWGRSMDIAEAAGGVGRFSFSQLCGKAMNADDYLKLTDHFHTILVTDVPRFGVEKHNEARRFTNLVDCLYERHARLVVTADAPLEELLTGMEGLVEFDPNPVGSVKRSGPPPNLWSSQGSTQTPVMAAAAESSGRGRGTGDDDTATGANIAGVMTGAVASLQESGFAARRAMSRLLHMQSEEYLQVHQRSRATL